MKKITQNTFVLSVALMVLLLSTPVHKALAVGGSDPISHFAVNCSASNKRGEFGFTTNENDPSQGETAILFIYEFKITPSGTTTIQNIIENLTLTANSQYPINLVVNELSRDGNVAKLEVTAGFTNELGIKTATDILYFNTPSTYTYSVSITTAQIYALNDPTQTNIYQPGTFPESFFYGTANACNPPTTTSTQAPGTTTTTTTAENTTTTSTTANSGTGGAAINNPPLVFTSNKQFVNPSASTLIIDNIDANEDVRITATINNAAQVTVVWEQTSGTQVVNPVTNNSVSNGNPQSVFNFTTPNAMTDETLKFTFTSTNRFGGAISTKNIEVKLDVPAGSAPAGASHSAANTLIPPVIGTTPNLTVIPVTRPANQVAPNNTSSGGTTEKNAPITVSPTVTTQPLSPAVSNNPIVRNNTSASIVHPSASLIQSGPTKTLYFLGITSLLITFAYRKLNHLTS
jgi:hypothetical protein